MTQTECRVYRVAGKTYRVPVEECECFDAYRKGTFHPSMKASWKASFLNAQAEGQKLKGSPDHIPSNLRAVSFSVLLADYAAQNWEQYEVKGDQP